MIINMLYKTFAFSFLRVLLTSLGSTKRISGYPDFLTGVYHSTELAKLAGVKNHIFSMGSHFVIIEWPQNVARLLYDLLVEKVDDDRNVGMDILSCCCD